MRNFEHSHSISLHVHVGLKNYVMSCCAADNLGGAEKAHCKQCC